MANPGDGGRRPEDRAGGADDPSAAAAKVGARPRVASRYPALGKALGPGGAEPAATPTIDDAATAAVEHKDGGRPVDGDVAARVGAHLGADFAGVRVHDDPLATEATAAMGARAFAYGGDVFLGPGESGADLGLMAHELTHVVQQGAAGERAPQRQVTVGAANSPAEQQADQVAGAVTAGGAPQQLLVDDGTVAPGQMLKSQFLSQLRAAVQAAADEELGPIYSAMGCPYIEQYFNRYTPQPASAGESLIKRYAPAARNARAAADMIPAVVARVREGVRTWRDTGRPPADLPVAEPAAAAAAAAAPPTAQALRAPDGGESAASLEAELGTGQALDAGTASRMSDALGVDVSSARVHTGPTAAQKASAADAIAFTVGSNIVMGSDAPAAGTLAGDALLAHELAHTAQQRGAADDAVARRQPIADESSEAEADADQAAAGAMIALHGSAAQQKSLARRAGDFLSTGLKMQRCGKTGAQPAPPQPAAPAIPTTHGPDQQAGAQLPTADQQTQIGYDLDPSSRPAPPAPQPAPQPGQPAPAPPPQQPRTAWDGRDGAPNFAQNRTALQNALNPAIAGYINDTRAQVQAAMAKPTVSYATTPAQGATPANPGVVDIAGAARGVLEGRFGVSMDAAASTGQSRGDRGPIVQGGNLFDPHSAADRGRLMGGQNNTDLQAGVVWWVIQNDNPGTAQGRRACTQELEAHHFATQDAGAPNFLWTVANAYVAAASPAEKQRLIDYRLYNWSERGSAGVTLLNSYDQGNTPQATHDNERRAHWEIFYTAVHELLHLRTHPTFNDAAQGRAVMTEGFTEMFTRETLADIVPKLRSGQLEAVRTAVEGNIPINAAMIPDPGTPAEYAPHLAGAQRIRDGVDAATAAALHMPVRAGVGVVGCRAAYFQGHVEYLGLSSGANGGHAGDPLPAADLMPAAGARAIRVPGGMANLDDLARRANVPRATLVQDNPGNADITAGRVPATAVLTGCKEHWVVVATTTDAATQVATSEPETRAMIAAQHGVSEQALVTANPDIAIDAATNAWPRLTAGQKILVPHP